MNAAAWFNAQSFNGRIAADPAPAKPERPRCTTLYVGSTYVRLLCSNCFLTVEVDREEDPFTRMPKDHVCDEGAH